MIVEESQLLNLKHILKNLLSSLLLIVSEKPTSMIKSTPTHVCVVHEIFESETHGGNQYIWDLR